MKFLLGLSVALVAVGCSKDAKWQDQPLEKVENAINGHRYVIEVPSGTKVTPDVSKYTYHMGRGLAVDVEVDWLINEHANPEHRTMTGMIKFDQNKVLSTPKPPIREPLLTKDNGDDWAYVIPDTFGALEILTVRSRRGLPNGALLCEAQVFPKKGDTLEKLAPKALALCDSLKLIEGVGAR